MNLVYIRNSLALIKLTKRATACPIAVIGLGGVGSQLAEPLVRLLNSIPIGIFKVYLVDGDSVEQKNLTRCFSSADVGFNKALVMKNSLTKQYKDVLVEAVPSYISLANINNHLQYINLDKLTILSCVDNLATRKLIHELVERRTANKKYTLWIDGGNGAPYNGQVLISETDIDPSMAEIEPSILKPEDSIPGENCTVTAASQPQIGLINGVVAMTMLSALLTRITEGLVQNLPPNVLLIDSSTGGVKPTRIPLQRDIELIQSDPTLRPAYLG